MVHIPNRKSSDMRILVTGMAGFIGFHCAQELLKRGHEIVGLDAINDYYDPQLKFDRLKELGIPEKAAGVYNLPAESDIWGNKLVFYRLNLEDREALPKLFSTHPFDAVCNLAAQAGVRYSLENPMAYVDSNIVGFVNLLECCRHNNVAHLVYASSSSVYGCNDSIPFRVEDNVDHPISLYAASKKSNELMAHTYSHLYGLATTGLRFFTVYGPWGRPDMAYYLFTRSILEDKPIKVFNHGKQERDFTYVDDIIAGMVRILEENVALRSQEEKYLLFNIGKGQPVGLMDFIGEIEKQLGKKATHEMMPMQPGDVPRTWASTSGLEQRYDYKPATQLSEGVEAFINWYKNYYSS